MIEECLADQMGRTAPHRADPDVDTRLPVISRRKLRMGIGEMQDADVAETADVVNVIVGADADAWQDAGAGRRGKGAQERPAMHIRHQKSGIKDRHLIPDI
jgi:hypothetical protein